MSRCRKCSARILWAKSERGRPMPLNAEPTPGLPGNIELDRKTMTARVVDSRQPSLFPDERLFVSHFATCPNAEDFRK